MISIVMAYHNRRSQLFYTLRTIMETKHKDFEIVIVDDYSDLDNNLDNLKEKFPDLNLNLIKMANETSEKWYRNPCVPYNIGFLKSRGDKILIQNPECCHIGDVLSYTDKNLSDENYLSFHCYATGIEDTERIQNKQNIIYSEKTIKEARKESSKWYNHKTYRPASLHFCTAITRKNLIKLNGFDERYALGHNFDDDDFIARVKRVRLQIDFVSDPFVIHQYHGIGVSTLVTEPLADNKELWSKLRQENHVRAPNKINLL